MGRIHFIGGEKGGVGKSMTSRLLAQFMIDSQMPFYAFDSDQSHETLSRFYGEYSSPIAVESFDSLDQLIEAAEQNPNHDIIVDLAAQTASHLDQWLKESDAFNIFQELGYDVFLWHVMDDGADSMFLLENLLNQYAEKPHYNVQLVVVKNQGRGEDFGHFDESEVRKKAEDFGGKFLNIAKLQSALTRKIDFNNLSFWAAANNRGSMSIAERRRVKVWLKNNYDQIRNIMTQVKLAEEDTAV